MKKIRQLPKGIQTFSKMIEDGYVYVDKTQHIYNIIKDGSYYFLSRPRRFGKSVLISTLKELFEGNKKLFKELWIESSDFEWQSHPVIHLSFNTLTSDSPEALQQDLIHELQKIAKKYSCTIESAPSLKTKFASLIEQLSTINNVVILIDEYDYPIVNNIEDPTLAKQCRDVLRDFFSPIKSLDPYLKFVFITGVSKFAKTSIFSGLNNLEDLTISTLGATLLGYTQDELTTYFEPYIKRVALQNKTSVKATNQKMAEWYDGYQFSRVSGQKIYNPYSCLLFSSSGDLNYWFESAY